MFTTLQTPMYTLRERITPAPRLELNRLMATAIVDCQFRCRLLSNPLDVLDDEYQGMTFALAEDERASLLSIHAHSLQELAQRLLRASSLPPIPVHQSAYVDYS
jgi:hypothetical protein